MDLYLLAETSNPDPDAQCIQLCGRTWQLLRNLPINDLTQLQSFTCVSYVWGDGRKPNSFHPNVLMSDRTLSVLESAMKNSASTAYWVDAFCIPPEQPQKRITLESMGFIYSLAKEVIVSLDIKTERVLKRIARSDKIDDEDLESLESDKWVESVWTYQEVVNSRELRFVTRDSDAGSITGEKFLNFLGAALWEYPKRHAIKHLDLLTHFPRLDSLQETLADWMLGGISERFALQIMSNMDRRKAAVSKYRFYSMIGSITKDPCQRTPATSIAELAETFMCLCEDKNDYSFIFSSSPRDEIPGRGWRPKADYLVSLISWHCWGDAQRAYRDGSGIWLENVLCLEKSAHLGEKGQSFLLSKVRGLGDDTTEATEEAITNELLRILKGMGYDGDSSYLPTDIGVFYPQTSLNLQDDSTLVLLVSTQVRWTFGAPGLAKLKTGEMILYVPGIFAGDVEKADPRVQNCLVGSR